MVKIFDLFFPLFRCRLSSDGQRSALPRSLAKRLVYVFLGWNKGTFPWNCILYCSHCPSPWW